MIFFFLKLARKGVTTEIVTEALCVGNAAAPSLEYSYNTFMLEIKLLTFMNDWLSLFQQWNQFILIMKMQREEHINPAFLLD